MNVAFVHIATINNYGAVLGDIVSKINAGLIHHVDRVFLCYVGRPATTNYGGKYENLHLSSSLGAFEFPTLNHLRSFCATNDCNVLYLHTKGVSTPNNKCIEDWRDYMLYFTAERFADCLEALKDHETCGVDLRDSPVPHYSGNFWWATSKHINTLLPFDQMPTVLTERHKAEFWVCSSGKHKSLWDCGIKQNERHLHRYTKERYRHELIK